MGKPKTDNQILPPFLYPSKNNTERAWMRDLKKKRLIRAVGPRLYTSLPEGKIKEAIRGSWPEIISRLFPKALLSHWTAIKYLPNEKGEIFITANTNRSLKYPGLTLHFLRGPKALESDVSFVGSLKASSFSRALLENLSAKKGWILPKEEIEKIIEEKLAIEGETKINSIRDEARQIAKKFKWQSEFKKLDAIIGALQGTKGTKDIKGLKSNIAKARARGLPYDANCFKRLEILYGDLRHSPLAQISEINKDPRHLQNKAFFEAYFSNYIEGTTFEIEEAEEIVFEKRIPEKRPDDAHDILGTYEIVSDPNEMKKTPTSFAKFETLLKSRHAQILRDRADALPGQFKVELNRVGSTQFVHPEYVVGSLDKGYELYQSLPRGMARAIFMMFLVTEVHPFKDGNGRVARIMMNAELFSQNLSTIIIPNVYRDDYLGALRALSRRERPRPLITMLSNAHKFSNLKFSSYPQILGYLRDHNWFEEPDEAKLI